MRAPSEVILEPGSIHSIRIFGILTLALGVCLSAHGAPELDSSREESLGETLIQADENLDAQPLLPSVRGEETAENDLGQYCPSMLVPRFGFGIAFPEVKDSSGFLGLLYGFESESFNPWEVGLDFLLKGLIQVQGSKRWVYFPKESVRPFLKAGLNWVPQPQMGLGNLIDWNRFQLRMGVGLDDLGSLRSRVRWEVEIAVSPLQTLFLLSLGFPSPL